MTPGTAPALLEISGIVGAPSPRASPSVGVIDASDGSHSATSGVCAGGGVCGVRGWGSVDVAARIREGYIARLGLAATQTSLSLPLHHVPSPSTDADTVSKAVVLSVHCLPRFPCSHSFVPGFRECR